MPKALDPFRFVLIALAGWMNQHQLQMVEYLREENRVLREQLGEKIATLAGADFYRPMPGEKNEEAEAEAPRCSKPFKPAGKSGLIADRNIARYKEIHRIDADYLSTLSADAVPALMSLPQP